MSNEGSVCELSAAVSCGRMQQSAQILQMREELLSSTKRDLNREISKLNETVNTKLQKVTILQDSVDKVSCRNSPVH